MNVVGLLIVFSALIWLLHKPRMSRESFEHKEYLTNFNKIRLVSQELIAARLICFANTQFW